MARPGSLARLCAKHSGSAATTWNGTLSIQTRIERHEQILRVLLWAASIVAGTLLTVGVLGMWWLC